MPRQISIDKSVKSQFLAQRFLPSLITWNRLEGRPRSVDFDRSLQAEVRDPLWMLCRQWQVGEFKGEDAGSAVVAKTQVSVSRVNRFAGLDPLTGQDLPARPYDGQVPLETLVEHEAIPLDLLTRAQMGRHWLKLIAGIGDFKDLYVEQYPFKDEPAGSEAEAQLHSDPQAWGTLQALQGRLPDGGGLYRAMTTPDPASRAVDQHAAWLSGVVTDPARRQALLAAAQMFHDWFLRAYNQPAPQDPAAWQPGYLEYQFACSAPAGADGTGQTVLVAEQYASGHLDWYSFDVDAGSSGLPDAPGENIPAAAPELQPPLSFVPHPITFGGMPAARWWELEDSRVDLGNIKPNTTDLAALLMADFGLVYGNDWSLVPYVLPVGTLSQVQGVVVKDVFGVKTLVRPAGQTQGAEQLRWGLFDLSLYRDGQVREELFLPPVVAKLQESEPIEKVILVRDDVSNMVWGVETTLPGLDDGSMNGFEAARALDSYLAALHLPVTPPPDLVDTGAPVSYRLGQGAPENWIPFIPVYNPGSNRELRLQRAAMPRLVPGVAETPVRPRGAFLRVGLDLGQPYFIHEEEVPKAGVVLTRSYQRTRWLNGQIITWLGRQKQAGARFARSGQGSSGLVWDRIV
jgi:hypothetical protein